MESEVEERAHDELAVQPAKVLHFTPQERAARGRAARAEAPRTSHATVELEPARDPVGLLDADSPRRG